MWGVEPLFRQAEIPRAGARKFVVDFHCFLWRIPHSWAGWKLVSELVGCPSPVTAWLVVDPKPE